MSSISCLQIFLFTWTDISCSNVKLPDVDTPKRRSHIYLFLSAFDRANILQFEWCIIQDELKEIVQWWPPISSFELNNETFDSQLKVDNVLSQIGLLFILAKLTTYWRSHWRLPDDNDCTGIQYTGEGAATGIVTVQVYSIQGREQLLE